MVRCRTKTALNHSYILGFRGLAVSQLIDIGTLVSSEPCQQALAESTWQPPWPETHSSHIEQKQQSGSHTKPTGDSHEHLLPITPRQKLHGKQAQATREMDRQ